MNTLTFKLNEPHIIKLSDTTADADGSNWIYYLQDGSSMSIPRPAAVKLNALFPEVGEELSIGRYRTKDDQPAEWVVSLTPRSEQARARKELAEQEAAAQRKMMGTARSNGAPSAFPAPTLKPTGTSGPAPLQMPKIAAKRDRQELPPRVPYGIALAHITGTVTALLREKGEQWNDQAKQDLVSTAFISAAKSGVIAFDFEAGEARP